MVRFDLRTAKRIPPKTKPTPYPPRIRLFAVRQLESMFPSPVCRTTVRAMPSATLPNKSGKLLAPRTVPVGGVVDQRAAKAKAARRLKRIGKVACEMGVRTEE